MGLADSGSLQWWCSGTDMNLNDFPDPDTQPINRQQRSAKNAIMNEDLTPTGFSLDFSAIFKFRVSAFVSFFAIISIFKGTKLLLRKIK